MKLYKFHNNISNIFEFKISGHKVQDGYREFDGMTAFGGLKQCIEWIKSGSSSAAFKLSEFNDRMEVLKNIYTIIFEIEFEKLEDLLELVPEEFL